MCIGRAVSAILTGKSIDAFGRHPVVLIGVLVFTLVPSSYTAAAEGRAGNLIEAPGFEEWNEVRNMPGGPDWRWRIEPKVQFEILERSSAEKHGGEHSLHLRDSLTGRTNDNLFWQMTRDELERCRGKALQFSAWIRQISASAEKKVGIGLWIKSPAGMRMKIEGPETRGTTDWDVYSVTANIPEDVTQVRAYVHCANNWGHTGEAYFDDLVLQVVDPIAEKEQASVGLDAFFEKKGDISSFYLFRDSMPPNWGKTQWGGLLSETSGTCAKLGGQGLRFKTREGARAYAGVAFRVLAFNRRLDCSTFEADKSSFQLWMNSPVGLQIALSNGDQSSKVVITRDSEYSVGNDGDWRLVKIPLSLYTEDSPLDSLHRISFQITEPLPKGKQILIDDMCLVTESKNAAVPTVSALPEKIAAELRDICGTDEVFTDDGLERPVIENGTFTMNGKPTFFLGPWTGSGSLALDWGPGSERDCLKDPLYNRYYDAETAGILGMNSMQNSCALLTGAELIFDTPINERTVTTAKRYADYMRGLQGMPVIMDFAFAQGMYASLIREGKLPPEAEQNNPGWHSFVYLCPEHPGGREAYHTYFRTGARATLKTGGNPYAWELYNESSYNCRCVYNRRDFAGRMQKQYGDINAANTRWGTSFASFTEAAHVPQFEKHPGLWIDWCKFSGDRYAEILAEQKAVIREVDKRERVYFLEQIALSNLWKYRGAGMDYRKIAEAMDILGVEGGWGFGRKLDLGRNKGNAMEAALATYGTMYSFALDAFRSLSRNEKPIVNVEHYCGRKLFGKRVPSRAEDITTAMWGEVFHGASGSYMYAWCKRVWEWKNYEEGKAMVINGGYKSHHLLVPYAYPRESLDGFKVFSEELDQVRETALPMPRLRKASVAVLHSYPTVRMSAISQINTDARIATAYGALLFSQYPLDVVMEEDVTPATLSQYQAIVLPFAENTYAGTLPAFTEYVRKGGIVLCVDGAFTQTEYGGALDASEFLGLTRSRIEPVVKAFSIDGDTRIPVRQTFTAVPSTATVLGGDVLFQNQLGKGKVFYLAGETSLGGMKEILRHSLSKADVRKYGEIFAEEGEELEEAEFQIIDRGSEKLMMLVNWLDHGTRLVRLRLNLDRGGYLLDPFSTTLYANASGSEKWRKEDLKSGVLLALPPQERLILMLQEDAPKSSGTMLTQEEIRRDFARIRKAELPELEKLNQREQEIIGARRSARFFDDVKADKCFGIDISKQVNMAFKDDIDGDRKGGWFDQGPNDFRDMPLGRQMLANVPFDIIDPNENGDKSAIILYGPARKYFPVKVSGIPVHRKAKRLYFLHGTGWGIGDGQLCHSYVVNYADGSSLEVPVEYQRHISGWWDPAAVPEAKIALESSNLMRGRIGLYAMRWENPNPEREISTIDIVASKADVVPAIVAITAEAP